MRHLIFVLILLLLTPNLQAAPYVYEGVVENLAFYNYSGQCQILSEEESPLVEKICLGKVKIKYKIYPLMGEPVEAYSVAWTIDPTLYLRRGYSRPGNNLIVENISNMPELVQEAFRNLIPVSPTEFAIKSFFGTTDAFFIFDGGALARSGKGYSYNTPGSPDWDDFIYTGFIASILNQDLSPLPGPKAKEAFQELNKDHFKYAGVRLLTFSGVSELNASIEGSTTYPLMINVYSEETSGSILDAKIKILNIRPRYIGGIHLKKGVYQIEISKEGYKTVTTSVRLDADHTQFEIRLKENSENPAQQQQADELEDIFDSTETEEVTSDNIFDEAPGEDQESLDDLLDQADQITLIVADVPRNTSQNVLEISGSVRNASSVDGASVQFKINGLVQSVGLSRDGSFSNKVMLFNGENRIDVVFQGLGQTLTERLIVSSSTPPVKAMFTLTWDSSSSDMDLHVYGPSGNHCFHQHRSTGNMQLDVDNTTQYGPENVSVKLGQQTGTYRVYIKHYGGRPGNVKLYAYLDNRLIETKTSYLSGNKKWHAYDLHID